MKHSETLIVTPHMAEDWLGHAVYEKQRRRAEWHVRRLALEMERGRFIKGTQIHFGVLDGAPKLLNGQHTLAGIVRSGVEIELTILRTPVADERELGELYGRHDRHRGRTSSDAFLGMGLAERLDLAPKEINSFAPALKYVLNGFRRFSVHDGAEYASSLDFLAAQMEIWAPTAREYFSAVREAGPGLKGPFRRSPVVAVGLATFQHQADRARAFWSAAAEDDRLPKDDPKKALVNYLLSHTTQNGDPITYIRCVAGAWNKSFEKGKLQFLRPGEFGKIGVTIRGTPFKAVRRVKSAADDVDDDPQPGATAYGGLGAGAIL